MAGGDWETLFTSDGVPYYCNNRTGAVTWDMPEELKTEADREEEGSQWLWIPHPQEAFVPAQVVQSLSGGHVKLKTQSGQVFTYRLDECGEPIPSMVSLRLLPDDLVQADQVNDATIVHVLRQRYLQDKIYTSVGDILIAVNPFKMLPLYTPMVMAEYRGNDYRDLKPHPYGVASVAYKKLMEEHVCQAILISGESGAGKTETTKVCLAFLSEAAGSSTGVEQKVLSANPILEAFGNAKTLRNNNSSRFGKFMELYFDDRAKIIGCGTTNYLLEKNRVVMQTVGERNYHIFYQLCRAAEEQEKYGAPKPSRSGGRGKNDSARLDIRDLGLTSPDAFEFLNKSECTTIPGIDDAMMFAETLQAFQQLAVSQDEVLDFLRVIAVVLHLGNLQFVDVTVNGAEGSELLNNAEVHAALNKSAELLQIDPAELSRRLRMRELTIRGEVSYIQLKAPQAAQSRDALCKALYNQNFDYLVTRVNQAMSDHKSSRFIGILDIFGFEIFELNSFEQLCINFANEKLQQHFNSHTFKTEEETYRVEAVPFDSVPYIDNQDVLDLIEMKPHGVIPLLDDEILVPKSTDLTFLQKLNQAHAAATRFVVPKGAESRTGFAVEHYAGPVTYNVTGFLEKNKDRLIDDLEALMNMSRDKHVAGKLFATVVADGGKRGKRPLTMGGKFRKQLDDLMTTLNATQPHYIRCIKPNSDKAPVKFDGMNSYSQLKCSGVFEAVTIRKKGYPFRLLHQTFYRKFWPLVKQSLPYRTNDPRAGCNSLIQALTTLPGLSNASDIRLGKTMVFWRSAQDKPLAAMKALIMDRCARGVQKLIRVFLLKCLLFNLRRIKPILQNALKSNDLRVVDAALEESSKIRFQLREHALLEEKRFVIIETARVTKEVERLATLTVDDIDDEFESIVTSAKKLGVNTAAAQRCLAMYQEVEDKRRVIAALRDVVKAETVELSDLESVLSEVDKLKPKYGNNFCREEEAAVREVLEIVRKEHFLVENIVQQISSGNVMNGVDARDPAMLMDLIEEAKDMGCRTQLGQTIIEMADYIVELRGLYRTTHGKCVSGVSAILPDTPRSMPGADGRVRDVWTAVAESAKDAKDVLDLPTTHPQAQALKAQLEAEVAFIVESYEYYRELETIVRDAYKSIRDDILAEAIENINSYHDKYGSLMATEKGLLEQTLTELQIEAEWSATLSDFLRRTEIHGPAESVTADTINEGDLQEMCGAAALEDMVLRKPESHCLKKLAGFKGKLRLAVKHAITMSSLPKEQKDFTVCKAAWDAVEGIMLEVNELQKLPGWQAEEVEVEVIRELILNQSVIQDVKDRLVEAIAAQSEELLAYGIDQADRLAMASHPDADIRAVVTSARTMFEDMQTARAALEKALQGDKKDAQQLRAAIALANKLGYKSKLIAQAEAMVYAVEVLSQKVRTAWQSMDRDVMLGVLRECQESNFDTDDVRYLDALVSTGDQKKFYQRLLKLHMFLQNKEKVVEITVRIKDLFFDSAGDMFALRNYSRLRSADEYGRGKSAFGFVDRELADGMLQFSADLIPTSLTQLSDEQTRTATSLFMCVMGYMGDRQYSYPPMLAQEILRAGVDIPELRDEVYVQVLKQLNNNPSNQSRLKGLDLLSIMLQSFAPSDGLLTFLEYFLRQLGETALLHKLVQITDSNNVKLLSIAEIGKASGEQAYASWLRILAKGRLYDSYKRKWFMLDGSVLRFFNEEHSLKEEQGHYNVSEMIGVKSLAHDDKPEKSHFAMEVENDGGSWVFVADTRKERDDWVAMLSKARDAYWNRVMSGTF